MPPPDVQANDVGNRITVSILFINPALNSGTLHRLKPVPTIKEGEFFSLTSALLKDDRMFESVFLNVLTQGL
jgi:hypothetical protein